MVSRRRALARSDGASGLRWLDRAPCAPKFAGHHDRMRSSLNRLGRELSLAAPTFSSQLAAAAALSLAHGSMGRKRDESGRGAFVSFVQSSYV